MTTLALLAGFATALALGLAWVVAGLRREVRDLSERLAELRHAPVADTPEPPPAPSVVPARVPAVEPAPRTIFHAEADEEPVEAVPVITRIAEPADDEDLTARRVASVTLARPLIKVAALSYGVRQALDDEHRLRLRLTMRRELKRQRKMRRRRRAGRQ
jgi:hypothetical protein